MQRKYAAEFRKEENAMTNTYISYLAREPLREHYTHQEQNLLNVLARPEEMSRILRTVNVNLQRRDGKLARTVTKEDVMASFEAYVGAYFPLSAVNTSHFGRFIFNRMRPRDPHEPQRGETQERLYARTKDPRGMQALSYPTIEDKPSFITIEGRLT
jgi:hypothetical protein